MAHGCRVQEGEALPSGPLGRVWRLVTEEGGAVAGAVGELFALWRGRLCFLRRVGQDLLQFPKQGLPGGGACRENATAVVGIGLAAQEAVVCEPIQCAGDCWFGNIQVTAQVPGQKAVYRRVRPQMPRFSGATPPTDLDTSAYLGTRGAYLGSYIFSFWASPRTVCGSLSG